MNIMMKTLSKLGIAGVLACLMLLSACSGEAGNNTGQANQTNTSIGQSDKEEDQTKPDEDIQRTITELAFVHEDVTLLEGESFKIELVAKWNDGSQLAPQELAAHVQLTSSRPDVIVVAADGAISASPDAAIGSIAFITAQAGELTAECRAILKYSLDATVDATIAEVPIVTNPDSLAVVVNKNRGLPEGHDPQDLVIVKVPFASNYDIPDEKKHMRKEAAEALEQLFAKAAEEGIEFNARSGYRSYQTQKILYNWDMENLGREYTIQYVAYPGTSEHQTGLSMDVSTPNLKNELDEALGEMKEGKWLAEHAADFGFIIRYPKGKEDITGYAYEPWHVRYVGKEIAASIYEQGITLEEYFVVE